MCRSRLRVTWVFSLDCFLSKYILPVCPHSPLGSWKHAIDAGRAIRSRGGQPILDEDGCASLKAHMFARETRGDCLTVSEFAALVFKEMQAQAARRGIDPATVCPPHEETLRLLRVRLHIHKLDHHTGQTVRRKEVCVLSFVVVQACDFLPTPLKPFHRPTPMFPTSSRWRLSTMPR